MSEDARPLLASRLTQRSGWEVTIQHLAPCHDGQLGGVCLHLVLDGNRTVGGVLSPSPIPVGVWVRLAIVMDTLGPTPSAVVFLDDQRLPHSVSLRTVRGAALPISANYHPTHAHLISSPILPRAILSAVEIVVRVGSV